MSAIAFDAPPPSALRVMPGVIMLALALGVLLRPARARHKLSGPRRIPR
jgi:hypothetical protein